MPHQKNQTKSESSRREKAEPLNITIPQLVKCQSCPSRFTVSPSDRDQDRVRCPSCRYQQLRRGESSRFNEVFSSLTEPYSETINQPAPARVSTLSGRAARLAASRRRRRYSSSSSESTSTGSSESVSPLTAPVFSKASSDSSSDESRQALYLDNPHPHMVNFSKPIRRRPVPSSSSTLPSKPEPAHKHSKGRRSRASSSPIKGKTLHLRRSRPLEESSFNGTMFSPAPSKAPSKAPRQQDDDRTPVGHDSHGSPLYSMNCAVCGQEIPFGRSTMVLLCERCNHTQLTSQARDQRRDIPGQPLRNRARTLWDKMTGKHVRKTGEKMEEGYGKKVARAASTWAK